MTDTGYLQIRADSTHCSVDGVFASGDVADWDSNPTPTPTPIPTPNPNPNLTLNPEP